MNKEIKQKWLEALKSGKYEQGSGLLRDLNNRFCCLGVLCDVLQEPATKCDDSYLYDSSAAYLPDTVALRAGIPSFFSNVRVQEELAAINDTSNSFDPVIEYIEKNL